MIYNNSKYTGWYDRMMTQAIGRSRAQNDDTEQHHILPKSLGGTNEPANIVTLTLREHFIAHRLLMKMTTGVAHRSMCWAMHRMMYTKKYTLTSRTYATSRLIWIAMLKNSPRKTPEWCEKMSDIVAKTWEGAEERRRKAGEVFARTWKEGRNPREDQWGPKNTMWGKTPYNKGKKYPGTGKSGARNPRAKEMDIICPNGTIITTPCLKTFCNENGLDYGCMKQVSRGNNKQHRGYMIFRKEGQ